MSIMSDRPESIQVGSKIDGFVVRRITPLENLRSTAYELAHEATGARILHLHNADAENLFSVTFPTPPAGRHRRPAYPRTQRSGRFPAISRERPVF